MRRMQYIFIGALSLGLVAIALMLGHFGYRGVSFSPCPLCILQRLGYLGIAFFCILAAMLPILRKEFHILIMACTAYGACIAFSHVRLLSRPESSCGVDPLEIWINDFGLVKALPWLLKADGLCSAKLPSILGLFVPQWSLLWFLVIFVVLLIGVFRWNAHK